LLLLWLVLILVELDVHSLVTEVTGRRSPHINFERQKRRFL
jgi:hypothetical protein